VLLSGDAHTAARQHRVQVRAERWITRPLWAARLRASGLPLPERCGLRVTGPHLGATFDSDRKPRYAEEFGASRLGIE
jgi:hypothetical protein